MFLFLLRSKTSANCAIGRQSFPNSRVFALFVDKNPKPS
jgi:hypothetical protein